ncbi:MAG: acyl carrier protein [Flavobacteriales bacterium]|nr:acyl carrier protein [Flavobacteriales bacterium]
MTAEEIKEIIKQEIQNVAFVEVKDEDLLVEQNILDSVGTVDLAVALEGAFGIQVPFVDINGQHFRDLGSLVAYVQLRRS